MITTSFDPHNKTQFKLLTLWLKKIIGTKLRIVSLDNHGEVMGQIYRLNNVEMTLPSSSTTTYMRRKDA